MNDDFPKRLPKDAIERAVRYLVREIESGNLSPHYRNSLLGLWTIVGNWVDLPDNLFAIHIGSKDEKTTARESGIPCEFHPVGFNVLDAYATCVLAADVVIPEGKEIVLSMSLDTGEALLPSLRETSDLWISLTAFSGGKPCIATGHGHRDLLRSLAAAVKTKELQNGISILKWRPDLVFLTSPAGCIIRMDYPGKMRAKKTHYLLQHPADEWPRATLRFPVVNELRNRARKVVDFLLNDPPGATREA